MGLPLRNIHDPTIGSASRSNGVKPDTPTDNTPVTDLMKQKDDLEAEMTALGSVLESHGVNMSTSLLTFDGFPRPDIDIAQIRATRARVIHLQNDHKAILARIEPKLHEYFAAHREQEAVAEAAATARDSQQAPPAAARPSPASTLSDPQRQQQQQQRPDDPTRQPPTPITTPAFALINTVSPASPAAEAGLLPGDRVQLFGEADWSNHDKLSRVAQIVGRSEGREISVVVVRQSAGSGSDAEEGERQVSVVLVPRNGWGGRGSLGCHLLPL